MRKAISATNLFKEAPTLHFYPENKTAGKEDVKVLKSRKKKVITLDIGPFHAVETILVDPGDKVHHSNQLRYLTPARCTYGYDVLVYVGHALFLRNSSQEQIIEELARRNVSISQREVGYLGRKFIAYLPCYRPPTKSTTIKEAYGVAGRIYSAYGRHLRG